MHLTINFLQYAFNFYLIYVDISFTLFINRFIFFKHWYDSFILLINMIYIFIHI